MLASIKLISPASTVSYLAFDELSLNSVHFLDKSRRHARPMRFGSRGPKATAPTRIRSKKVSAALGA